MNDELNVSFPMTIAAAAALSRCDRGAFALGVADLILQPGDIERATRLWHYLCGVPETAPEAARLRVEVARDGDLLVALSLPAVEFVHWFRDQDWELFDSAQETDSTAWGMSVLQRAWAGCKAMGALATQCAFKPSAVW